MELVKDFTCPVCKRICTRSGMVYIDHDRLYHETCRTQSAVSLTHIEMASLEENILMAHCHPYQGATFAVKVNYFLLCFDCQNSESQKLNISNTKVELASSLRSIISKQSTKVPEFFINQWKKVLKKDSNSKKIHAALIESSFFLNSLLICKVHCQYANKFNLEKFIYSCEYCNDTSFESLENIDKIVKICIEKAKQLKTPGFFKDFFASFIEIVYNTCEITDFKKKTFLLLMHDALDNLSSSSIDSNCICLYCREKFGFGLKQAVQLHEDLRHEVCIKCFLTYNISQCLIDWESTIQKIIICKYTKLIDPYDKKCSDENNTCTFDIKNGIIPYKVCCKGNICQNFIDNFSNTLTKTCPVCSSSVETTSIHRNEDLIQKLKFIEVHCPIHNSIALFFNKKSPVVKCKKCSDVNTIKHQLQNYNQDYLSNVVNLFELYQNQLNYSFMAGMIKSIYPLIPAQKIYDTLWYLESLASGNKPSLNFVTINRFSDLSLADSINIYEQWRVKSMTPECIKLSFNGVAELHGIIVGNPIDSEMNVSISINNISQKSASLALNVKFTEIIFDNPIYISTDWTHVSVVYSGSGKYIIHGFPSALISDLRLENSKLTVDADEDKMHNGNNAIGGPILAFIFNKIHLNEEESTLYNLITKYQYRTDDLFLVK